MFDMCTKHVENKRGKTTPNRYLVVFFNSFPKIPGFTDLLCSREFCTVNFGCMGFSRAHNEILSLLGDLFSIGVVCRTKNDDRTTKIHQKFPFRHVKSVKWFGAVCVDRAAVCIENANVSPRLLLIFSPKFVATSLNVIFSTPDPAKINFRPGYSLRIFKYE